MKLRLNLCVAALMLAGALWAAQGYGELSNTAPTSRPEWLWIGLACIGVGGIILALVNRPGGKGS